MKLNDLLKKLNQSLSNSNKNGIAIPTARDPKTGKGSVSLTMLVVSFGLMSVCTLLALALVVNKWGGFFVASDTSINTLREAFYMAFQMSGLSAGLYWGRKFQNDGNNVTLDSKDKE